MWPDYRARILVTFYANNSLGKVLNFIAQDVLEFDFDRTHFFTSKTATPVLCAFEREKAKHVLLSSMYKSLIRNILETHEFMACRGQHFPTSSSSSTNNVEDGKHLKYGISIYADDLRSAIRAGILKANRKLFYSIEKLNFKMIDEIIAHNVLFLFLKPDNVDVHLYDETSNSLISYTNTIFNWSPFCHRVGSM